MLIPIMSVHDMAAAVAFYTERLDFRIHFGWPDDNPIHVGLIREGFELHLALAPPGRPLGHCGAMILVEDIDAIWALYLARGLIAPVRPESPVHEGPLDQTWGTREVYIDDPSGNRIILQQR